jgi:hypothetical protein
MTMKSTYTPFSGWQPDADPTSPGVLTEVFNMIPTVRGYKSVKKEKNDTSAALTGVTACARGAGVAGGTEGMFAGAQQRLWLRPQFPGTAWIDKSRGGLAYAGSVNGFAQYGNIVLAAVAGEPLQQLDFAGSSPFSDITGSPTFQMIETVVPNFVMGAGYTNKPNGIWWSALGNYLDWTPSTATQSGNIELLSGGASITGLKRLGSNVVVYKYRRTFIGEYVGSPGSIWRFREIPGEVGAVSQRAVVNVGYAHFFRGEDDFYMFDGTRPISIGGPVRDYVNNFIRANVSLSGEIAVGDWHAAYDTNSECVWFFLRRGNTSLYASARMAFIYNVRTQQWGKMSVNAFQVFDRIGDAYPAGPIQNAYEDILGFTTTGQMIAYQNESTAAYEDCSLITGWFGDEVNQLQLNRVLPRMGAVVSPASVLTCDFMSRPTWNAIATTDGSTVSLANGSFDRTTSRNWHKLRIACVNGMEIQGLNMQFTEAGRK